MLVGIALTNGFEDIINKLAALPKVEIEKPVLIEALNTTIKNFRELGGTDQIAKGPNLLDKLLFNQI